MSRHFELMQQLEKERLLGTDVEDSGTVAVFNGRQVKAQSVSPDWASEEALRLVQQIFLVQTQEPPRVVVFASIDHGNGCSGICASVAETLARYNRGQVCLVEGNFRSPSLPSMFGVSNHFGLTEALMHKGPAINFAKPLQQDNLWLLSSGTLAVDSANLLTSDTLRQRVDELRQQFDFVVIDAPPLNRYGDGIVLGQLADGLVMVLEANSTRREAAAAVAESLRSAKVSILAAVLNKRTFPIPEAIYNRL